MGSFNNTDYASKGLAGSALGLGIGGLALSLLNGNGGLGGLFGGNNEVSRLQAENAQLHAQQYSDRVSKETYAQTLQDLHAVRNELYAYIKPLAEESANNRVNIATLAAEQKCDMEKQKLQAEITAGKINETALALNGKIETMTASLNGTFDNLNRTISCIQGKLNDITQNIVPITAVSPQPMPLYNSWCTPSNTCSGSSTVKPTA